MFSKSILDDFSQDKKHLIELLICLLLIILLFFLYSNNNTKWYWFTTPDSTTLYYYTHLMKNDHILYWKEPLNVWWLNIFHNRWSIVMEDKVISAKMIWYPFFVWTSLTLHPDSFILYINILFSLLWIIYIYKLSNLISQRENYYILILSVFFPVYWYWSNLLMENVLWSVFFLLWFYYLVKIVISPTILRRSYINYILVGLFLGVSFFIRLDTILFYPALLIFCLVHIKKINFKNLLFTLLFGLITIFPLLYFQNMFYGSPFRTAQNAGSTGWDIIIWGGTSIKSLQVNSNVMMWAIPGLFILFIFSILIWVRNKKTIGVSYFLFFASLTFSLFYLTWALPKRDNYLHESYTRYFLPIYIIFLAMLPIVLNRLKHKMVFVVLIICISISYVTPILKTNYMVSSGYKKLAENLFLQTESGAIIYTQWLDKIIFPLRKVWLIDSGVIKDERFWAQIRENKVPQYFLLKNLNIDTGELLESVEQNGISYIYKNDDLIKLNP